MQHYHIFIQLKDTQVKQSTSVISNTNEELHITKLSVTKMLTLQQKLRGCNM